MNDPTFDKQIRDLVYELKSCANEYDFPVNGWELCMGTIAEKEKLEKKYYPLFSTKLQPELLLSFFITLHKSLHPGTEMHETTPVTRNHQYLIAFNPERIR